MGFLAPQWSSVLHSPTGTRAMGFAHADVVCIGAGKESCPTSFVSRDAEVHSTAVKG